MTDAAALILAAGRGERLGADAPKAFLPLAGTTMVSLAARSAARSLAFGPIVLVVPGGWEGRARSLVPSTPNLAVVRGGATRQESVRLGLHAVPAGTHVVACHDAARPFASPALFSQVVAALTADQDATGVIPVIPIADTVKRVNDDVVTATESRENLVLAQTPQAFRVDALADAHARALAESFEATDDAALVERFGGLVRTVPGEPDNFKVTTPEDLARAESVLSSGAHQVRTARG